MTHSWKPLGRGKGKRPDGVRDSDRVRFRLNDECVWVVGAATDCHWFPELEYELRIDQPTADAGNVHEARTASNVDVLREALQHIVETAEDALAATEPAPMEDV